MSRLTSHQSAKSPSHRSVRRAGLIQARTVSIDSSSLTSEQVRVFSTTPSRLNLFDSESIPILIHCRTKCLHQFDSLLDDLCAFTIVSKRQTFIYDRKRLASKGSSSRGQANSGRTWRPGRQRDLSFFFTFSICEPKNRY